MTADDLDALDIDISTTEVLGVAVTVDEDSSRHSDRVRQTLYVDGMNLSFEREGFKIVEYENWVDTHWYGWSEV